MRLLASLWRCAAVIGLAGILTSAGPDAVRAQYPQTTTKKPDGGSIVTITKREGTECSLFTPQGALQCSRTISETNHTAAIAKCVKMKC